MKDRLDVLVPELQGALGRPPPKPLTIAHLFYDAPDGQPVTWSHASPDDPALVEHTLSAASHEWRNRAAQFSKKKSLCKGISTSQSVAQ